MPVLRVLMVASEARPYAKVGGLADVVTDLTRALRSFGVDARILTPAYRPPEPGCEEPVCESRDFLGFSPESFAVTIGRIQGDIPHYRLHNADLYSRRGIYGSADEPDYIDNVKRFSLLCRTAARFPALTGFAHEIVHAHDWPTAAACALVRRSGGGAGARRAVLTIHNAGYQGIYSKHDLHYTGLERPDFEVPGKQLEEENAINLLGCGISAADGIVAVSPTYAREILSRESSGDLAPLLTANAARLTGIRNGIDPSIWNPRTDPLIPYRFEGGDLTGKAMDKRELQRIFGVPVRADVPLIGMVSRLVDQKGFVELCDPADGALDRILGRLQAQVVILGTGDSRVESALKELAARHENLGVRVGFDERMAHLVVAGSDFYLMPSRTEPCGLNQMYALAYGSVPIVTKTGGLADTVVDIDEPAGTGFVMPAATPAAILAEVERALLLRRRAPARLAAARRRGMAIDFGWEKPAAEYLRIYRRLIGAE